MSTVYKGRTLEIQDDSDPDLTYDSKTSKWVVVNGTPQFSYQADDAFIFGEAKRYIDAVDAWLERARQLYAAGAYVPTRNSDFADSWRTAA